MNIKNKMNEKNKKKVPELELSTHDNKVDVFSFGMIFWSFWIKQRPFPKQSEMEIHSKIKRRDRSNVDLIKNDTIHVKFLFFWFWF